MFKNLKLGKRIGLGFAALVLIACAFGVGNALQITRAIRQAAHLSNEYIPAAQGANDYQSALLDLRIALRSYGLSQDEKYLNEATKALGVCKE